MALYRTETTVIDKYGVDPLLDKALSKLSGVTISKEHTVTEEQRGRPDLIAYKYYGTVRLWWVILAYNNLIRHSYIKEGMRLYIPDISQLSSHLISQTLRKRTRKVRF